MRRTPAIYRGNELALAIWLVALLLSTHGCGPRNTPILIMLSGDMMDAESVQITPWLNGAARACAAEPSVLQAGRGSPVLLRRRAR